MKKNVSKYAQYIPYLKENLIAKGFDGCAVALKLDRALLQAAVDTMRKNGIDIPMFKRCAIGDLTVRTGKDGVSYKFQKTATGWKRVERITPYADRSKITRKSQGLPPNKAAKNKPKPEVKKYANKVVTEPMKLVRVNAKTQVLVPIGENEADVIERYYKRYEKSAA